MESECNDVRGLKDFLHFMKSLFPPHLLNYHIFGFLHEEPSLFILFPKFLCKDKITNHVKIRDAKILVQNKCQSISSNEFI